MLCRTFCMIFGFLLKVDQTFRTKPYYLTKPTLRQILITKQKVLTNNFVSYYNKQAENSEYIKNKEYRNNMNEFKFYGEENTETMMPFSYGNNRQKKRQKKKENTKSTLFWTTRLYFCLSC